MLRSGLYEQIISQSLSRELASVPNKMTTLRKPSSDSCDGKGDRD